MDEELRFHLDMEIEQNIRKGMSPAEARHRAMVAFGGLDQTREKLRVGRQLPFVEPLFREMAQALRAVRRSPGFAAVAFLMVAMGVGATTSMFSVANAFLLRPLPIPEPENLYGIWEDRQGAMSIGMEGTRVPFNRYESYEEGTRDVFRSLAAHVSAAFSLRTPQETVSVEGMEVSGNYFTTLGLEPHLGHFFSESDAPEVVISHGLWQRLFSGDSAVVGGTVHLDGKPLTLVAVAPEAFLGLTAAFVSDLWVPAGRPGDRVGSGFSAGWVTPVGRLRPGVSQEDASSLVRLVALNVPPDEPQTTVRGARLEPVTGVPPLMVDELRGFFTMLVAAGLLVLLIAAANLANALMARGVNRRREIAIRSAIGAGRTRVVAHLLAENFLLFLVGGVGGVGLAYLGTWGMGRIPLPPHLGLQLDLAPDLRVLAVALLLTLSVGMVFGLVPAFHGTRFNLVPALKLGLSGGNGHRSRLRGAFVAGQTAMSVLLLIVAFLFFRSLKAGLGGEPGFDSAGVVVAGVDLGPHGFTEDQGREYFEQLLERVRAIPAVESAGLSMQTLGIPEAPMNNVSSPDAVPEQVSVRHANYNVVGLGLIETMGMELVAGRGFNSTDAHGSPEVVLVSENLAEGLWPGRSPIGRRIRFVGDREPEVVGVVRDGRYLGIADDPRPYVVFPHSQLYASEMQFHIRTSAPADVIVRELKDEARALDPNVAVEMGMGLQELLGIILLPQWLASTLVGVFGFIGMALAALGTYGILAYQVAQRTREFGVRRALGAGREGIVGLVLRQGAVLAAWGCGLGILAGVGVSQGIRGFLFGVAPLDPLTFATVPFGLFLVALLASFVPAVRAAKVSPIEALRQE